MTVGVDGAIVLPESLRMQLKVGIGGQLIIRDDGDRIVLEVEDDAVTRAQALVRRYASSEPSVTEELLAERRVAAGRE